MPSNPSGQLPGPYHLHSEVSYRGRTGQHGSSQSLRGQSRPSSGGGGCRWRPSSRSKASRAIWRPSGGRWSTLSGRCAVLSRRPARDGLHPRSWPVLHEKASGRTRFEPENTSHQLDLNNDSIVLDRLKLFYVVYCRRISVIVVTQSSAKGVLILCLLSGSGFIAAGSDQDFVGAAGRAPQVRR